MNLLERALQEHSGEFIDVLTGDLGLSRTQAEVFLAQAGPALVDSYRWQADRLPEDGLAAPSVVRDLLAGINGRRLAPKVGLPADRTWDGLRVLVPAVVRSTEAGRGQMNNAGRRGVSDEAARFDVGFGLSFEHPEAPSEDPGRDGDDALTDEIGSAHPIFGRLFRNPSANS